MTKGQVSPPLCLFLLYLCVLGGGRGRLLVLHALGVRAVPAIFLLVIPHFMTTAIAVFFCFNRRHLLLPPALLPHSPHHTGHPVR